MSINDEHNSMNLHEECLLKYLLNPMDLMKSTEELVFCNNVIKDSVNLEKLIHKQVKVKFSRL